MKLLYLPYLIGGAATCLPGILKAQSTNEKPESHPNIIWITCEDLSPYIGCYGDTQVRTPNIDQLAREGMLFQSMYTVAGVSSPSRSCFITGMYPTSIGTHHMRTLLSEDQSKRTGIPSYSAVVPDYVKAFPEYLRRAGYYTTNNMKTDYQFEEPVTVWDECGGAAGYRRAPKGKPLFCVYNLFITHESQLFAQSKHFDEEPYKDLLISPDKVTVPPYLPDTPLGRETMARLLSNAQIMDHNVGQIIAQLKKDGLYDNSYIFFFSDHGGSLPWMKREILERGTHIPFIVKFPKGQYAGTRNTNLVSSVDIAPTVLSLANVPIPDYMQGRAFLGSRAAKTSRNYVFAARDRFDEKYDRVRSVRDNRFRYIYNFMPDRPKYMDLVYRKGMSYMNEILQLHADGKLNAYQEDWFTPTKPTEELYDVEADPNELHNLAADPAYADKLDELRKAFRQWMDEVGDLGYLPEKEMLANWWHGEAQAPQTAEPLLTRSHGGYLLSCPTPGASIGYKISGANEMPPKIKVKQESFDMLWTFGRPNGTEMEIDTPWNVYTEGTILQLKPGQKIIVNARRIGYRPTEKTFTL